MKPPRRLTLDDSNDAPFAWLPDSRTVLFRSDRRGTLALFKQRIDSDSAEVLVSGKENVYIPRAVTSSGSCTLHNLCNHLPSRRR
jgi:Tol biopolymer transport system component